MSLIVAARQRIELSAVAMRAGVAQRGHSWRMLDSLTDDLACGMIAIPNALRQRMRWIVGAA
jgi:hypothetical protein